MTDLGVAVRGPDDGHGVETDRVAAELSSFLESRRQAGQMRSLGTGEARLGAGRDLEGVRRVVLDSVVQAQGKGCAPGVLGVCVGGDRVSGFEESKCQLLRPLADPNPDSELADLEERLLREGNELGIGPMGFGGETTLLGVKLGVLDRLPASYFVTISYMCWADRRAGVRIENGGEPKWLS